MRYRDIVEGRDSFLYHFMSDEKAVHVLPEDHMPARWKHKIDGREYMGNSFTRNRFLNLNTPVVLVVDQRKLSTRNQIIPVDGEWVMRTTYGLRPYRDKTHHQPVGWSEEFVIGDIKPLHDIVVKIKLRDPKINMRHALVVQLHEIVKKYCEKYAIILEVHDDYQKMIDAALAYWAEMDEEDA